MKDEVVDTLMALGWAAVRREPRSWARRQFDTFATVSTVRNGPAVQQLRRNLRRVVPDRSERSFDRLIAQAQRSYLRYWRECFQLPTLSRTEIVERSIVLDEHNLRDSYAEGNGMILALPHSGNWDQAGAWLVHTGVPFTTVAERLKPASLFDRFVAFRESLGMEVIPLTGGERPPYPVLAERLSAGGCVCLLADRDLTATGVQVDFFGEVARMASGPARLALQTGAALVPVTLSYPDAKNWQLRMHPPITAPKRASHTNAVVAMTQRMADAFADDIAQHPADWHMYQRIWLADLDERRLPAALGASA